MLNIGTNKVKICLVPAQAIWCLWQRYGWGRCEESGLLWGWAVNWLSPGAPKIRRADLKLLITSTGHSGTDFCPSLKADLSSSGFIPSHHDQVEQTCAQVSDPLLKITLAFLWSGKEVGWREKEVVHQGGKVKITKSNWYHMSTKLHFVANAHSTKQWWAMKRWQWRCYPKERNFKSESQSERGHLY